jgi:tetraacyldisaccharide 4'-kinase
MSMALATLTAPMAVAFAGVVRARNLLYDTGLLSSRAAPIPVVSIGNLAVGGTGKTPVSAWVAHVLRLAGRRPAIVMRGYGEDEILLHRRWNPDVPVFRAPSRAHGTREAVLAGSDVVILDDGFQHRALRRDLNFVLLSPAHPLPARLLPRGPFREPLAALRRAHRVLVTAKGLHETEAAVGMAAELRKVPGLPPVDVFSFRLGAWAELDGRSATLPPGPPFVVTAVAEPEGFARGVGDHTGGVPECLSFPDHHAYSREDAERIGRMAGGRWIAVTEKDAVKLLPFQYLLPTSRVLALEPVPPAHLADAIVQGVAGREAR